MIININNHNNYNDVVNNDKVKDKTTSLIFVTLIYAISDIFIIIIYVHERTKVKMQHQNLNNKKAYEVVS